MKKIKLAFFIAVFGLLLNTTLYAQAQLEPGEMYRVVTTDGNTFIGTLVSENEDEIVIKTENLGQVTIIRSNIRSIEEINENNLRDGEYWHDNPQSTRYLFSTNALGLEKGEGYYQNTWIFFNNVNFGITNNFSLGGGLVPTFLFGNSYVPVWIMPKVSIPISRESFHIAAGGLFGGVIGESNSGIGLAYGVATVGNRDSNFSFGLGYGYADGKWADIPLINLSGMHRMSKNTYLITENYFVTADGSTYGLISAAFRWAPENFAVDFGLIRPTDIGGEFIGVPWLGVTIPIGR
ncbi:MAG TPA: hypothetical protein VFM80_11175 [Gracilimonas sp.]|uniref:hypothetical protein n=1 Tax=Gracilimonas sp. TaxID=1974203 RepID=UPI002DA2A353|nr:hypothetical protein [Gracilimonas sp.]